MLTAFHAAVYVPSNISISDFESFLQRLEPLLLRKSVILVGDFNLPRFNNLASNSSLSSKFQTFIQCTTLLKFMQHNHVPNCNERCLDLVFTSFDVCVEVCHEELPLLSEDLYHPKTLKCYNFKKATFVKLYNDIIETERSSLSAYSDVNDAVTEFYRIFYNILDSSVPLYSHKKPSHPVWFDKQIVHSITLNSKGLGH